MYISMYTILGSGSGKIFQFQTDSDPQLYFVDIHTVFAVGESATLLVWNGIFQPNRRFFPSFECSLFFWTNDRVWGGLFSF